MTTILLGDITFQLAEINESEKELTKPQVVSPTLPQQQPL